MAGFEVTTYAGFAVTTEAKHLIIVGGRYVGIVYRRFGAEVTIIEKAERLISHEDSDVSAAAIDILKREGIHVRLDAECITLARHEQGVSVGVACPQGEEPTSLGSHVLLAVGRTPNTHDLGLDKAGVAKDDRGYITVDDYLCISVPGIYALGDSNGRGAFTHTSYKDYEIIAGNLQDNDQRSVSNRILRPAARADWPHGRTGP